MPRAMKCRVYGEINHMNDCYHKEKQRNQTLSPFRKLFRRW